MMYDLVVIGAGPAGLAAACTGAELGLRTVLFDEQQLGGGQIYRNLARSETWMRALPGGDYQAAGSKLMERFQAAIVDTRLGSFVWDVARDLTISALQGDRMFQIRAPQIIGATGAMERPSPIPGWTLPGVMNVGAAQIALKSAAAIPSGRVVLAGGGPLLLLAGCQLHAAGAQIVAVVETSPASNIWNALLHLPAALRAPEYLLKGARMLKLLRSGHIPRFPYSRDLSVEGRERCSALCFTSGNKQHRIEAETVLLHHGVIANSQLSRLLGVEHVWDDAQLCWRVKCNEYGATSLPGFRVAGDCEAISGALAAEASGALAALGAAHELGQIDLHELDRLADPHKSQLSRHRSVRPFLDALYRPPGSITEPADDTIVCRCEEVTAATIRQMARLGCQGPNQAKFFSRCGMGPCQGRVCGTVVTQLLATSLGKPPDDIGAYRVRAPLKPIPLSALAHLEGSTSEPAPKLQHDGLALLN